MKAYLIDANSHAVSEVVSAGLDDIKQLIGYDSVDPDEIDASGDRLFFDESCFFTRPDRQWALQARQPHTGCQSDLAGSVGDDGVLKSATVVLAALQQRTI